MKMFKVIFFGLLALHALGSTSQERFKEALIGKITSDFNKAVVEVRNLPKEDHLPDSEKSVPMESRLKMYALYKQATEGDCPEAIEDSTPLGVMKHEAWMREMGLDKHMAMNAYVKMYKEIRTAVEGPSA